MGLITRTKDAVLVSATVITAAETLIGTAIDASEFNKLSLYFDYVNGDETDVDVYIKFLPTNDGNTYDWGVWTKTGSEFTFSEDHITMSVTGSYVFILDVEAQALVQLYTDANGGTPTGTLAIKYRLSRE